MAMGGQKSRLCNNTSVSFSRVRHICELPLALSYFEAFFGQPPARTMTKFSEKCLSPYTRPYIWDGLIV